MKFLTYNPEQAYLLPPSVREVLGADHVCFFVHRTVERLDLSGFEQSYVEEGRPAYHPALLLKVWLYADALGITSARRWSSGCGRSLAAWSGGARVDWRAGRKPIPTAAFCGTSSRWATRRTWR